MATNKEVTPEMARANISKQVVQMRTRKLMSWAAIGAEFGVAPRTARRLFQEAKGDHQHHDHLPNKGGRFPTTAVPAEQGKVRLAGNGAINTWVRPDGTPFKVAK